MSVDLAVPWRARILMQRGAVVVGERVARILGLEIVGNAGKSGAMSREVEQGDLCSGDTAAM